jgi:hypothetical protein
VTDGGMRVWHFNGVITTYGKRDCRNSWRYASLAVNRGAIKWGFTVYFGHYYAISNDGRCAIFTKYSVCCYVFSAVYISRQNIPGENIRSASGFFIAGNPFVKNKGFPFLHFRLI